MCMPHLHVQKKHETLYASSSMFVRIEHLQTSYEAKLHAPMGFSMHGRSHDQKSICLANASY